MGGEQTDGKSDQPLVPSVSTSAWFKVFRIPRASYQNKEVVHSHQWFVLSEEGLPLVLLPSAQWKTGHGVDLLVLELGSRGQQAPCTASHGSVLPSLEAAQGAFPSHSSPTVLRIVSL